MEEKKGKLWAAGLSSELLYRQDLSHAQKLLISIISGYMQTTGEFFCSNARLAEALSISSTQVSILINDLADKQIISLKIENNNKRFITFTPKEIPIQENLTPQENLKGGIRKLNTTPQENLNISNNININVSDLNIEDEKTTKLIEMYFSRESDNGSGRLSLKKYPNIFLKTNELESIIELFKNNGLSKNEYNLIFTKCQNEMEMKHRDFRAKGGLAYKYLTGYLLEEALKLKKVAPRANLDVQHNYNSQPIPNNIKNIINKAGIK